MIPFSLYEADLVNCAQIILLVIIGLVKR